jgi:hypothetical protein
MINASKHIVIASQALPLITLIGEEHMRELRLYNPLLLPTSVLVISTMIQAEDELCSCLRVTLIDLTNHTSAFTHQHQHHCFTSTVIFLACRPECGGDRQLQQLPGRVDPSSATGGSPHQIQASA